MALVEFAFTVCWFDERTKSFLGVAGFTCESDLKIFLKNTEWVVENLFVSQQRIDMVADDTGKITFDVKVLWRMDLIERAIEARKAVKAEAERVARLELALEEAA